MNELEAIRHRLEAATPGPWDMAVSADRKWALVLANSGTGSEHHVARASDDDDAEFIAYARTDVSRLLAAIDDLLFIADNKTADNQMGRWWRGVIRGTIEKHIRTPDDAV